jgi:hypothetical protein
VGSLVSQGYLAEQNHIYVYAYTYNYKREFFRFVYMIGDWIVQQWLPERWRATVPSSCSVQEAEGSEQEGPMTLFQRLWLASSLPTLLPLDPLA